jgi:hypothetical protein
MFPPCLSFQGKLAAPSRCAILWLSSRPRTYIALISLAGVHTEFVCLLSQADASSRLFHSSSSVIVRPTQHAPGEALHPPSGGTRHAGGDQSPAGCSVLIIVGRDVGDHRLSHRKKTRADACTAQSAARCIWAQRISNRAEFPGGGTRETGGRWPVRTGLVTRLDLVTVGAGCWVRSTSSGQLPGHDPPWRDIVIRLAGANRSGGARLACAARRLVCPPPTKAKKSKPPRAKN